MTNRPKKRDGQGFNGGRSGEGARGSGRALGLLREAGGQDQDGDPGRGGSGVPCGRDHRRGQVEKKEGGPQREEDGRPLGERGSERSGALHIAREPESDQGEAEAQTQGQSDGEFSPPPLPLYAQSTDLTLSLSLALSRPGTCPA